MTGDDLKSHAYFRGEINRDKLSPQDICHKLYFTTRDDKRLIVRWKKKPAERFVEKRPRTFRNDNRTRLLFTNINNKFLLLLTYVVRIIHANR